LDKICVVADTNILISSVFWSGNPYKIVQKAIDQEILIFVSDDILNEARSILRRDFEIEEQEIEDIINALVMFTHFVKPIRKIDFIKEDPDDNIILECAVSVRVDYIITGDDLLLKLKKFENTKIVGAKEFLDLCNNLD